MSSFHWSVSSFLSSSPSSVHLSGSGISKTRYCYTVGKTVLNVVVSLIGVLLPFLFTLTHSSLRLRNLKNKVLLYILGRRLQMSSFHWSVSSFLSSSPSPTHLSGSGISKTRYCLPFGKTVANVVFSLIGVFLIGLIYLFLSLTNLSINVINCLSKFGRLGRSSFPFPERFPHICPEVDFLYLCRCTVFSLRSFFIWALALGCPLYSVSFSSMYRNTDQWLLLVRRKLPLSLVLTSIGQKKASSHWLVFTRDTRNKYRKKSSGQTHLFNIVTIGAMDRAIRWSWAYCAVFLLKIRPLFVLFPLNS